MCLPACRGTHAELAAAGVAEVSGDAGPTAGKQRWRTLALIVQAAGGFRRAGALNEHGEDATGRAIRKQVLKQSMQLTSRILDRCATMMPQGWGSLGADLEEEGAGGGGGGGGSTTGGFLGSRSRRQLQGAGAQGGSGALRRLLALVCCCSGRQEGRPTGAGSGSEAGKGGGDAAGQLVASEEVLAGDVAFAVYGEYFARVGLPLATLVAGTPGSAHTGRRRCCCQCCCCGLGSLCPHQRWVPAAGCLLLEPRLRSHWQTPVLPPLLTALPCGVCSHDARSPGAVGVQRLLAGEVERG